MFKINGKAFINLFSKSVHPNMQQMYCIILIFVNILRLMGNQKETPYQTYINKKSFYP